MSQRIVVSVYGDYPDDLPQEDIEHLIDDLRDVAHGFGGKKVLVGWAQERGE